MDKRYGTNREETAVHHPQCAGWRPQYSAVKPRLASLAGKSISSLIRTQGIGDLYRLYLQARRDGIEFNLISMPEEFTLKETTPFDQVYMKALFDEGYRSRSERCSGRNPRRVTAVRAVNQQQSIVRTLCESSIDRAFNRIGIVRPLGG